MKKGGEVFDFNSADHPALAYVVDRGEILGLKDLLDEYNNLGCPIDAHCRPHDDLD